MTVAGMKAVDSGMGVGVDFQTIRGVGSQSGVGVANGSNFTGVAVGCLVAVGRGEGALIVGPGAEVGSGAGLVDASARVDSGRIKGATVVAVGSVAAREVSVPGGRVTVAGSVVAARSVEPVSVIPPNAGSPAPTASAHATEAIANGIASRRSRIFIGSNRPYLSQQNL